MKLLIAILAAMAVNSQQVLAATAEAGHYQIDPAHTNIGFEVSHLGISLVVGRFNTFNGDFRFSPGGESTVEVEIEVASIDTNVEQRDSHLRSPDFFSAAQFPKMKFVSTSVSYDESGNPISMTGDLTLHGQTKSVLLTIEPIGAGDGPMGDYRVGFKAKGTIKRSEFGMTGLMALAGDEVTILLNVEGIRR